MINFKKYIIPKPEPKRYVIGYIGYQHAAKGTDDYEGWQDFYSFHLYVDKEVAYARLDELKRDRFARAAFLAEEVEAK